MTIDDLDDDTVYQSMSAIIEEGAGAIPPEPRVLRPTGRCRACILRCASGYCVQYPNDPRATVHRRRFDARKTRRLPLESYDPLLDFDADTRLQCRLDVVYPDGMVPEEVTQLRAACPKWGPGAIAVLTRWARMANDQLQKSFPSTANGTDELAKLPGYALRTAAYVDDHAQGSHSFADLLFRIHR